MGTKTASASGSLGKKNGVDRNTFRTKSYCDTLLTTVIAPSSPGPFLRAWLALIVVGKADWRYSMLCQKQWSLLTLKIVSRDDF